MKFIHLFRCNIPLIASKQLWRTMRIFMVIMTTFLMQVSASTKAQQLTIKDNSISLREVFSEIRKQTGYNVLAQSYLVNKAKKLNLNLLNVPLEDALKRILEPQDLEFTIKEKAITIKEKEKSIIDKVVDYFTSIDVTGKVVDENGQPIAGATIRVKGTSQISNSGIEGLFILKNVPDDAIIEISYIGFLPKEIKASRDLGVITLQVKIGNLDEVTINAGYYNVKQRELTGSISKVSAETIGKQPVNNPLLALQNRVPGLDIVQQTGLPGGNFSVRIRGRNSISSGLEPLYVLDGVSYPSIRLNTLNSNGIFPGGVSPLSMINPNDIESIEVLKDADATAIYGSRGANGVILITTKKGITGDLMINANISHGGSQVGKKLQLLNTEQYIALRMEAFKNDGITPGASDYDVNGTWDKNKYTDWQEEQIGRTAAITNAAVSVSGGNSTSNYLISGNYYQEGTVFPGDFCFKRAGLHTNLNFGSNESRFKASLTATYSSTISKLMQGDPTYHIFRAPNAPDNYDQFGQLNWANNTIITNPAAVLLNTQDANTDNLVGNINFSYRVVKNLTLSGSFGYNTSKREEVDKLPNAARRPTASVTSLSRASTFGNSSNVSWISEPRLNYETNLGKGRLNALIGMGFQENTSSFRSINASNFNSDELMGNISSASVFSIRQSDYVRYKYASLFSRINYNMANKYYLNLTARRDGSSKFGPGKQFANFGAIGAAWIFTDEKIIKDNFSFLSFGKFRASYGLTGNDQIQDYQYLQLFNSADSYQGSPTLVRTRIANPDYAWETTKKAEAALQLGFLKDRINIQVAFYKNRSSNQLTTVPLPPSVGAEGIIANLPAIVQNTGWEFEGDIKWISKENWGWTSNFNLSIPKNKLVAYENLSSSTFATSLIIGQPLDISRFYDTTPDPQTGLYTYDDLDKNGVISDADRSVNKFLGRALYGGLQNAIRYQQFTLGFLFSFIKQDGNNPLIGQSIPGVFIGRAGNTNQPISVLDRWQRPGDVATLGKVSTSSLVPSTSNIGYTYGNQSFTDASFIRLKNISFSYTLPKEWLSKLKIKNLALYAQGQNIFTLSKYQGLDPETQNFTTLPPLRTVSVGLNLTL